MSTDLRQHIQQTPLCDTHEHLRKETEWVENGPADVLQDLFTNYVPADLVSAGATQEAMTHLQDSSAGDLGAAVKERGEFAAGALAPRAAAVVTAPIHGARTGGVEGFVEGRQ